MITDDKFPDDPLFWNVSETDDVVECPTLSHGIMIWIHDNVTGDHFTLEYGEMRIEQKDKGVYRCLLGIINARLHFKILKRDGLTLRIAEPIQIVYGDPLDLACLQRGDMPSISTMILIHSRISKETKSLQNFKHDQINVIPFYIQYR